MFRCNGYSVIAYVFLSPRKLVNQVQRRPFIYIFDNGFYHYRENPSGDVVTWTEPMQSKFGVSVTGDIGAGYRIGKGYLVFDLRAVYKEFPTNGGYEFDYNGLPVLLLGYEFCF